jgi:AcrR family transcriptional regulator
MSPADALATRARDPARKERILAAAADLVARNGCHAVSMGDIGAAAGITGSGTYRNSRANRRCWWRCSTGPSTGIP